MTAPDWARVQAEFPINARATWLNNCGISPMPGPVLAALTQHLGRYAAEGVLGVPSDRAVHASVRARLARLLGCDADELCLVHNTNEAMTFLSHGVTLTAGDHILLLENDYPSNVYPFQHWQARGVELSFAPVGASPAEFLAGFAAALRPRTRVVALSAVHWCTGMPLPLSEIGRVCGERGIDFFVDGAQGVGLLPIDVRAAGITGLGFSAWKWLLGPIGLGALYVPRARLAGLRFPWKGTGCVEDDERYLPYRDAIKPTTERYVLSTPNYNDWVHLDASLAYLEGLGFPAVQARIHALTDRLTDGLRAAGFALTRDGFRDHATGIVAASKPGHDSGALVAGLARANIVAAERLGRVRLAPHVYLSEAALDGAVATLADLAR